MHMGERRRETRRMAADTDGRRPTVMLSGTGHMRMLGSGDISVLWNGDLSFQDAVKKTTHLHGKSIISLQYHFMMEQH